jgi:hypothetical protein
MGYGRFRLRKATSKYFRPLGDSMAEGFRRLPDLVSDWQGLTSLVEIGPE